MARKTIIFCVIFTVFCAPVFCNESLFIKEVEGLRREITRALMDLATAIKYEDFQIQEMIDASNSFCNNNETSDISSSFSSEVWNMNQVASRCEDRVQHIEKKINDVATSFKSEEEKNKLESELNDLNKEYEELTKKLDVNSNSVSEIDTTVDSMSDHLFYLKRMNTETLRYLITKSPWRPRIVKLEHRKLKLRITGCPSWIAKCSIYNIATFDKDSFIVTYTNQSSIRRFNTKGNLMSDYKFPWRVSGIHVLNKTHVIVGAPEKKALIIMSVLEGFKVDRYVFLNDQCGSDIARYRDEFMIGCQGSSTIRIYSLMFNLRRIVSYPNGNIVGLMQEQENLGMPSYFRLLPHNPRGAVYDVKQQVWYMISTVSNEVQKVSTKGLNKRTIFYVRKPTCIAMLDDRLVIGTDKGIIYLATK